MRRPLSVWEVIVLAFPVLHLCLCVAVWTNITRAQESWGWFPVFFVDFPASVPLLFLANATHPMLAFGVLGTAWWYLVARTGAFVVSKAARFMRGNRPADRTVP